MTIYVKPKKKSKEKSIGKNRVNQKTMPAGEVEMIVTPMKLPKKNRDAKKSKKVILTESDLEASNASQEAGPSTLAKRSSQSGPSSLTTPEEYILFLRYLLPVFLKKPMPIDEVDKGIKTLDNCKDVPSQSKMFCQDNR